MKCCTTTLMCYWQQQQQQSFRWINKPINHAGVVKNIDWPGCRKTEKEAGEMEIRYSDSWLWEYLKSRASNVSFALMTLISVPAASLATCHVSVNDWLGVRNTRCNGVCLSRAGSSWMVTYQRLSGSAHEQICIRSPTGDLTLTIDSDAIQSVDVVRDLGVWLDSETTMKQHMPWRYRLQRSKLRSHVIQRTLGAHSI
jgi:hypothetical protein